MPRPNLSRVPEYYHRYINQVPENDITKAFSNQTAAFIRFLKQLPEEKRNYRYAKGKWTIKEVLIHVIDTERVFAYRSLCIARQDKSAFPSFDENLYADNAKANKRDWNDLIDEFKAVRLSTEIMFRSFDKQQLDSTGIASGKSVYVLGLGYIIAGHVNHHLNVIKERYLRK
ncbi:MAG: DinB family protein [Chitinophagaceae bacterium]|nr:DinB family protein [Chitinophagaceae bacterium]